MCSQILDMDQSYNSFLSEWCKMTFIDNSRDGWNHFCGMFRVLYNKRQLEMGKYIWLSLKIDVSCLLVHLTNCLLKPVHRDFIYLLYIICLIYILFKPISITITNATNHIWGCRLINAAVFNHNHTWCITMWCQW